MAALDMLLQHKEDKYDGILVEDQGLPDDEATFASMLTHSIEQWTASKRKGIWLKLPLEKAKFVPIAAELGFSYHHAENRHVMMTRWLSDGENRLPANASHQVGVGCIVVHEGKLLLVQEKSGPLRGTGIWKIPTGLADASEDLGAAAEREIFEETGIEAEFVKILCFRHAHKVVFEKSDLFFLCFLKPKTFAITHQEAEITACEWKEPEALTDQPFFLKSPVRALMNTLIRKEIDAGDAGCANTGIRCRKLKADSRLGEQMVYYPANSL